MILTALLAAAVQGSSPPATPAVKAVASICGGTTNVQQPIARALGSGWAEAPPPAGSEFALLVGLTGQAGSPHRGRTFSREIDGRKIYLWVRQSFPQRFAECNIYDFGPDQPEAIISDLIRWRGRAPEVDSGPMMGGRAVAWSMPGGAILTGSIETLPCPTRRGCTRPRVLINHSIEAED